MPLIKDDEGTEQEQEQQLEPIDQITDRTIQTGASFKRMLAGFGGWLARRKLPDSAKHGLREFGQEIWYSKDELRKRKGQKATPQKWSGTPFRSFGPEKKEKKGKL